MDSSPDAAEVHQILDFDQTSLNSCVEELEYLMTNPKAVNDFDDFNGRHSKGDSKLKAYRRNGKRSDIWKQFTEIKVLGPDGEPMLKLAICHGCSMAYQTGKWDSQKGNVSNNGTKTLIEHYRKCSDNHHIAGNPQGAAGPPAAAATGGDWRSQIDPMARQVMVKHIFKTLRWHLPLSGEEGRSRLEKIAVGFECKFYTEATSKDSYKQKIAKLWIHVENMNQNSHRQENGADDKVKAPMSESPGDEITQLQQNFWDSVLYPRGYEDPTYESTDNRATNLKKRKCDCSSSSAPPLGHPSFSVSTDDLFSSLAIPGESSTLPSWERQLQWAYDS